METGGRGWHSLEGCGWRAGDVEDAGRGFSQERREKRLSVGSSQLNSSQI